MNKFSKTFVVFALVLCFVLTAALFVACNDDKDDAQPETITYTVTVTCEDASALANVKVQLNKADGTSAAEAKALDANGKATFDLAPANYTATLTGVPADYQFANGSLTSETKECTIAVTKNTPAPTTYAYSVTVTYPAVNDVYGNQVTAAGPAAGVKVSLYDGKLSDDRGSALDGKTPAATKTTGADGKATFELTGELYTVVLSDYPAGLHIAYPQGESVWTVAKTAKDAAISFTSSAALGSSSSAPLALQLGANEIPLTNDALEATYGMGVCYSFTPAETSNYTFTSTGNAVVLASDGSTPILQGEASTVLSLTAGEPYILYCIANGPTATYTLTIAKGGEITPPGGGGDSDYDGEGTLDEPYVLTTLAGTVTFTATADDPVYFAYTATANETYTISSTDTNIWLTIFTKHEPEDDYDTGITNLKTICEETMSYDLVMTSGTTYYFSLDYMSGTHETSFTGTLKGSTPPGGDTNYPWTEGEGTVANPFTTTTLAGTYNLHIEASSPIYLAYTPTANETYTFSTTSNDLWIEIYDDVEKLQAGDDSLLQLSDTIKSGEITLTAATKYYILIGTWNDDENDINFTATKNGGSQPTNPWTSGEGTLASPYVLTSLEHTFTFTINEGALVYLKYTPSTTETYIVSSTDENIYLDIYKDTMQSMSTNISKEASLSATITFEEGHTYFFQVDVFTYGEETTFTCAKQTTGGDTDPEGNITFTVTVLGKGADGQTTPLAGVTVTIRDDIENPTTKTTDDQGKVTFTEKSGTYGILITGYPDTYQDDPYASYSVSATQRDLTITLNEVVQYDLAVTVKTVTGESVGEGVQIDAVDDSYNTYSAKTDAQGIAHIKAPAGTYTIQIKKFLMPGLVDNGPTGDNFEFPADMYTVTVTEAGAAITVQYQYLRTLDVTVKNADGTAVEAGTEVTIMDDIGHEYSATTDASGVAHFDKAGRAYLHDTETYSVYVEGNADSLGDVTINGESNTKEVTLPAKAA